MLAGVEPRVSSPVLVGRSGQLAALDAALAEAGRGGPSAVMVGGEAGVGKSRLITEFAARSRGAGARVLAGRLPGAGRRRPAVRPVHRGAPRAGAGPRRRRAWPRCCPAAPPGSWPGCCRSSASPAGPDDAGEARARLFEQMLTLLERLAEASPVVLIIEDAHWADRSTRDLLAFLIGNQQVAGPRADRGDLPVRRAAPHPSAAAAAGRARPDRLGAPDGAAAGSPARTPMSWSPGSPAASRTVTCSRRVYRRSEGNPLFVEALLGDGGTGRRAAGVAARPAAGQRAAAARGDAGRCSGSASAGGERTGHALLAAVTGLDGDDLARALRPAVAANVLLTDDDGYVFRHALIREAVYDDLLPGERSRLHSRFAEVIAADPALVAPGRAADRGGAPLVSRARHDLGADQRVAGGGGGGACPGARRAARPAVPGPRTVGQGAGCRGPDRRRATWSCWSGPPRGGRGRRERARDRVRDGRAEGDRPGRRAGPGGAAAGDARPCWASFSAASIRPRPARRAGPGAGRPGRRGAGPGAGQRGQVPAPAVQPAAPSRRRRGAGPGPPGGCRGDPGQRAGHAGHDRGDTTAGTRRRCGCSARRARWPGGTARCAAGARRHQRISRAGGHRRARAGRAAGPGRHHQRRGLWPGPDLRARSWPSTWPSRSSRWAAGTRPSRSSSMPWQLSPPRLNRLALRRWRAASRCTAATWPPRRAVADATQVAQPRAVPGTPGGPVLPAAGPAGGRGRAADGRTGRALAAIAARWTSSTWPGARRYAWPLLTTGARICTAAARPGPDRARGPAGRRSARRG